MLIDSGHLVRDSGGWSAAGDLGRGGRAADDPGTARRATRPALATRARGDRARRGRGQGLPSRRGRRARPGGLRATRSRPAASRCRARSWCGPTDPISPAMRRSASATCSSAMPRTRPCPRRRGRICMSDLPAGWSAMVGDHVSEYEEILGYHLEQAYRYRVELGSHDSRTAAIGAQACGCTRRSRDAERSIAPTSVPRRSCSEAPLELAPSDMPDRSRLAADLGQALVLKGELRRADAMLAAEIERYRAAGDELGLTRVEVSRLASPDHAGRTDHQRGHRCLRAAAGRRRANGDDWTIERASFELARHQFFAGHAQLAENASDDCKRRAIRSARCHRSCIRCCWRRCIGVRSRSPRQFARPS